MAIDALDRITKLEVLQGAAKELLTDVATQIDELDKRIRHVERIVYIGVGIIAALQVVLIAVIKSGAT